MKKEKTIINKQRFLAEFSRRLNANQRALLSIFSDSLVPLQIEGRVSSIDMKNLYKMDYSNFNKACELLYPELIPSNGFASADASDKSKLDPLPFISIGFDTVGKILDNVIDQKNSQASNNGTNEQPTEAAAPATTPTATSGAASAQPETKKSNTTLILVAAAVVLLIVVVGIFIAKKK